MDLLGGHDRESVGEVEAHLVTEYGQGAGARSVRFLNSLGQHPVEEVVVLQHEAIVPRHPADSCQLPAFISRSGQGYGFAMAQFDVDGMIERYKERAQAVRDRPLPPVAGAERQKFINQAQTDYTDFALVGNASWEVDGEELILRIPLNQGD